MEGADTTSVVTMPWLVRVAEKVAAKNETAVIAKGQRSCILLLILNMVAELGSWSVQFLSFIG